MPARTYARPRLAMAVMAVALALSGADALAAGGGGGGSGGGGGGGSGSGGSGGGGPNQPMTVCLKGMVYDPVKQICVRRTSSLSDDVLTGYAYALAKAERFDEALEVLDSLREPNTSKALNYRGYATRKLGRTDEGIGYYLKSVAMDPGYVQVREYLGEAYVVKGRLDLAREQLGVIEKLCGGRDCEEFEDLNEAIEHAR